VTLPNCQDGYEPKSAAPFVAHLLILPIGKFHYLLTVILSEVVVREADDNAVEVEALSGRLSPLPKSRAQPTELASRNSPRAACILGMPFQASGHASIAGVLRLRTRGLG